MAEHYFYEAGGSVPENTRRSSHYTGKHHPDMLARRAVTDAFHNGDHQALEMLAAERLPVGWERHAAYMPEMAARARDWLGFADRNTRWETEFDGFAAAPRSEGPPRGDGPYASGIADLLAEWDRRAAQVSPTEADDEVTAPLLVPINDPGEVTVDLTQHTGSSLINPAHMAVTGMQLATVNYANLDRQAPDSDATLRLPLSAAVTVVLPLGQAPLN